MAPELLSLFSTEWRRLSPAPPWTLLLSGGGDSVALFHLLLQAPIPFQALHFEHDGDPQFAARSREFCQTLSASHQIRLDIEQVEGRALQGAGELSWEAACRRLRYQSLKGRVGSFLTAHTADDQLETVVMRLLDGSGLGGLGGIHQKRLDGVVRPLLRFSREQLRAYLRTLGQEWLEDPTNQEGNERARIRHRILPSLLGYKEGLRRIVGRTALRLQQDEQYLVGQAQKWLQEHRAGEGDSWTLESMQRLDPALRSRVLRIVWSRMAGPAHRPRATLFEECFRLFEKGTNEGEVLFPGGWGLQILGPRVWLRPRLPSSDWQLTLPSQGDFAKQALEGAVSVSSRPMKGGTSWRCPVGAVLRGRRPGDRFRGRSLKKLLGALPHPPWVRDRWPILVYQGEVVAVWGLGEKPAEKNGREFWIHFSPSSLRAGDSKNELL